MALEALRQFLQNPVFCCLGGEINFLCFGFTAQIKEKIIGLYYKTITIVTLMIICDATIWSITYDRN